MDAHFCGLEIMQSAVQMAFALEHPAEAQLVVGQQALPHASSEKSSTELVAIIAAANMQILTTDILFSSSAGKSKIQSVTAVAALVLSLGRLAKA